MLLSQKKKNHKSSQNTNRVNISKSAQRTIYSLIYSKCLKNKQEQSPTSHKKNMKKCFTKESNISGF